MQATIGAGTRSAPTRTHGARIMIVTATPTPVAAARTIAARRRTGVIAKRAIRPWSSTEDDAATIGVITMQSTTTSQRAITTSTTIRGTAITGRRLLR